MNKFKAGDIAIFTKSGNKVQLIEKDTKNTWVVSRVDGSSKGKQMIVNESALVLIEERDEQ